MPTSRLRYLHTSTSTVDLIRGRKITMHAAPRVSRDRPRNFDWRPIWVTAALLEKRLPKSGAFEVSSATHDDVNEAQQFAQEHVTAQNSENAGVDAAVGPPFPGGDIGNNNHLSNANNIRQLNQYRLEREEATRREGI
ncbi:hypothetical protein THAOC_07764, partial [Thalassiosira oceanica]